VNNALETYGAHAARLVLIVVVALVVRLLLNRAVRRLVQTAVEGSVPVVLRPLKDRVLEPTSLLSERRRQRTETLGSVLRSIVSFTVAAVAGAMILSELGLDLAPVVASAGIVGVAFGFGAQNLIKDFLTGMFMILEDQYGVGDVIDAGPATGAVEAVGLRTTRLRDVMGTVWHIRNGEIARVGNKSQGWTRALVDLPVALHSDVGQVRAVALAAACSVFTDPDWAGKLLQEPQVWGLESIAATGLVLRVALKTAPQEQDQVAREVRERIAAAFETAGIALASPPA
jgi:small-conductance mechanosensitive channel